MQRKYLFAPVVLDPALGERQIMVVASDPTLDRTKDVMRPEGCILDNYRENNIVLANHDPTHPIGNATVTIRNNRVEALVDFAPAGISAKADEYCGLAKAGVLRAVSVGFDPIEYKPNKAGGYDYDKWELMELSVVAVPANPGARIIARAAELDPVEVPRAKDLLTAKGMWGLACLCEIMENLGCLQSMTAYEAEMEGDGSNLPAMLGESMRSLGNVLIAMSREEVAELLASAGAIPDAAAEAVTAAAPVSFLKALAAMRAKAGRALSQTNAEHVSEITKALDAMSAAHAKALNAHGKANDALAAAQNQHAAAAEHAKALFEAGKKPDADDEDEDPEADRDNELAAAAARRKRQAAVIALRAS
jgi:HK97 family phage prohead protease